MAIRLIPSLGVWELMPDKGVLENDNVFVL
jgi:hypothetical protein